MRNLSRRRLTVFDAIFIIAGFAAPIGIYRWLYPPAEGWPIWNMSLDTHENRVRYATGLIYLSWPILLCVTAAFVAVRLMGPRPRCSRLLRQPGAVAGFTALTFVVTSVIISRVIADLAHLRMPTLSLLLVEEEQGLLIMAICQAGTGAGYSVATAWFLLAVGRRRFRWAGWIDAWGVLLGLCWIAWSISYTISPHF